ncbi:MAG: PKD domain-containing protein, partial [Cyclobacteriaceae bacterium]|nr:PKD domain-containing protein [Cyclobacteriaceae bacterium]
MGTPLVLDAGNPSNHRYRWSTGATTQTISIPSVAPINVAQNFSVVVIDNKGCEGSDNIDITERPTPAANFSNSLANCPTQNVSFTNSSSILTGTMTYAWDFGDPASTTDNSTLQDPVYAYPIDGNYTVQLTATSSFGCANTQTKNVTVFPFPVPSFTNTTPCLGQPTVFTNTSTISPAGGGMTYFWDFGDGTNSSAVNPSKLFSSVGSYTVTLTATSSFGGCVKLFSSTLTVNHTPVPDFSVNTTCELVNLVLTNNSTITSGTMTYSWDFGDATTDVGTTPIKSYTAFGTYPITLTATSGFNCVASIIKPVIIHQNPVAAFSFLDDCQDQAFPFTNASTSGQGSLTFQWDFGDTNSSTIVSPTHSYTAPGTYPVSLKATTSFGCENTLVQNLTVFPMPVTDFSIANTCKGEFLTFNNNSSIISGTNSYTWDFGDATTSTQTSPTRLYTSAGTYTISLTSVSNHGCTTSQSKPLTIHPLPVVDLGGTVSTCGSSLQLDAQNPGNTYVWSTGSTSRTITVTSNGTYSVGVTNSLGCLASSSVVVTLNSAVTPDLGPDKTVCGSALLDARYPGSTYLWSTGQTTRTIRTTTSGNYQVTVTDQNGCLGSDNVALVVNPQPVVNLGSDVVDCADKIVSLDAGNPGLTYLWSDNSTARTLLPRNTGNYWAEAKNSFGCAGRDTVRVEIKPLPVNSWPSTITACDRVTLDAANPGSTYVWSDSFTGRIKTISASGPQSVRVTTSGNCSATFSTSVTVNQSPSVFLGSDQQLCFGQSAFLDAGSTGDTYRWSDGTLDKTLIARRTGIYWAEVQRNNGCFARDSVSITIFPDIVNAIKSSYEICANAPLNLDATSPQGVSYQWNSGSSTSSGPRITVNTPTNFTLTTTNAIGCTRTDQITITPDNDPITARFLAATLADVGDSLRFVQLSFPDPVSFAWDFKDGITSTASSPVHAYFRPGDFDVMHTVGDQNNCFDTKTKTITIRLLRNQGELNVSLPFVEVLRTNLFPNPVSENIKLDIGLNQATQITIGLYSLEGRFLESINTTVKDEVIEFDVHKFP